MKLKPSILAFASVLFRKSPYAILVLTIAGAFSLPADGADLYWDFNGSSTSATGGTGNWTTTNSGQTWRSGSSTGTLQAWADGNNAIFGGTAGTVTSTVAISSTGLTFGTTGYVVTGSGALTLTAASGSPTISLGSGIVATAGTWVTNSSGTAYLKGTSGLTVDGGGELILAAGLQSSLSGGVKVTGGSILTVGDRNQGTSSQINLSLGSGAAGFFGGNTLNFDNGTLRIASDQSGRSSLSGLGTITVNNTGTVDVWRTGTSASMSPSIGAAVTMNAGSTLAITTGGNTATGPIVTFGALTANGNFALQSQNSAIVARMAFTTMNDGGYQMTLLGGGTGTSATTGPINTYTTTGSSFTGSLVLGNSAGTQGALWDVGTSLANLSTKLTNGNISINPYSQLLIGGTGSFGAIASTLTLNGIGNITNAGVGNSGSIRTTASGTNTWLGLTVLGSNTTITPSTGNTLILDGSVSGAFQINKAGAGTLTFNGANASYTGSTWLTNGAITVNSGSKLGSGALKMGDDSGTNTVTLNLNNSAQTIGSLTQGSASVTRTIALGTNHALTIVQTAAGSYGGTFTGSTGSLTLGATSTNTLTLSGANTYGGGTTISAATFQVGVGNVGSVGSITSSAIGTGTLALNGGTLSSDSTTARTILNAVTVGGDVTLGNATNTGKLTFSAAVNFGGATRQFTAASDVQFDGIISNGGLTKAGTGTVTLTANNSYTGGTTVSNGTLTVNTGGTLGTSAGALSVNAATGINSVLNLNVDQTVNGLSGTIAGTGTATITVASARTLTSSQSGNSQYDGILAGSGALAKSGAGTLTLTNGSNTYSGGTAINGGTLQITGANRLGSASGALTINNGTFQVSTSGVSSGRDIILGNANSAIVVDSGLSYTATNAAVVSSTGTLNKSGAGSLILAGANTYSGGTVLTAGTIAIGSDSTGSVGSITNGAIGTGNLILNGGGLRSDSTTARAILNTFDIGGDVLLGSATATGKLSFNAAGAITGGTRTITTNSNVDFNAAIGDGGNTYGITKAGAGVLSLTGTNTYTAATNVNAGTLIVGVSSTGSITSDVTVATGGTLGGTGTIGGSVTVSGGTYGAGNADISGGVGTQTVMGNLGFAESSIFNWDLNESSTATGFDKVATSGTVTVSDSGTLFNVVLGTTALAGIQDTGNAFWNTPYGTQTWSMESIFGQLLQSGSQFGSVQTNQNVSSYGSFTINGSSLTWTAVPEPTSALVGLLITAGLLRRRRVA